MKWVHYTTTNLLGGDGLGGEVLEGGNGDVGDDGVETLLLGALGGLGNLAVNADADAGGDTLDTTGPDEGVEGGVNTVVLGLHHALGEGLDALDGDGGTLVEGLLLEELGQVDGALDGDVVGLAAGALALGSAGHTTDAALGGGTADTLVEGLLLVVHLGEDALPALVVLVLAGLNLLLAGGDDLELGVLANQLSLQSGAGHLDDSIKYRN
eukprot:190703_1